MESSNQKNVYITQNHKSQMPQCVSNIPLTRGEEGRKLHTDMDPGG